MKKGKKLTAILMALCLALGPAAGAAAEGLEAVEGETAVYEADSEGISVPGAPEAPDAYEAVPDSMTSDAVSGSGVYEEIAGNLTVGGSADPVLPADEAAAGTDPEPEGDVSSVEGVTAAAEVPGEFEAAEGTLVFRETEEALAGELYEEQSSAVFEGQSLVVSEEQSSAVSEEQSLVVSEEQSSAVSEELSSAASEGLPSEVLAEESTEEIRKEIEETEAESGEAETDEAETDEEETDEAETEEAETVSESEADIDNVTDKIEILHKAGSKKGLISDTQDLSDLVSMGVQNTTITWNIYDHNRAARLLNEDGSINSWGVLSLKNRTKAFCDNGIVVYLILVLPNYAPELLRYPDSDGGPYYVAWNTADDEGIEIYTELMETLAREVSPYVSHWVIGNEVNDNIQWHYMGPADIETHVKEYAKLFRLCYDAVREVNPKAQLYIPVDHRWKQRNNTNEKYDTKDYLDLFDREIQNGGNIDWCLAFHAYSIPLSAPEVWDDGSPVYSFNGSLVSGGGEISNHDETFAISMKNIDILTNYFASRISKNTAGAVRPIALTEQGYTSYSERTNADASKEQATSIAYAYNKAVSNPNIESFILSRQIDAQEMGISYYKFGLSNASGQPKYSHEVFRYLGSGDTLYTSAALPAITSGTGRTSGTLKAPTVIGSGWKGFYNAAVRNNDNISLTTAATADHVLAMKLNNYNASGTPFFCVTATVNGCRGTGSGLLRLYSDEKIWEAEVGGLTVGDEISFLFDARGWAGLGKLTGAEFWVRRLSGNGSMKVSALTASADGAANAPKITPEVTGLKAAAAGMNRVTLSWEKTPGAIGYIVLRDGKQLQGGYVTWKENTYTDTGASPDKFNYYWVIPVLGRNPDGSVQKGKIGRYVWAIGRTLGTVSDLKAVGGSKRVQVSWKAADGANAYVVISRNGKNAKKSTVVTTNAYTDTSVTPGTAQFYWVYPIYRNNEGKTVLAGKLTNYVWAVPYQ